MFSKMNKIVLIILFFLMLFIIIQSPVVQAEDVSIGTIIDGADDFVDKGINPYRRRRTACTTI